MADPPGAPEVPLGADQQHGGYPVHPPRPTRKIGAGDTPYTNVHRHGITPPPIPNINFEIKTSLVRLVENSIFHGMKDEDPLKHIDKFDRICSLQNIIGVSEDAFKLRLFPFSLGGRALTWETFLPFGSVTTWEQCKLAFLAKFFPASRTAKLRHDISGFTQMNGETFCEAYERFKGYQVQCPHHGFSKESLLSTLYMGVLPKYRMFLDTASNGHFLGQDVETGLILVENFLLSDDNYSEDYHQDDRGSSVHEVKHKMELKTLNDKLDKLLNGQQKQVHFINGEEIVIQEGEETQAQGGSSSGQDSEMKQMLQQLLQGQVSGASDLRIKLAEIHNKADSSHHELTRKVEELSSKVHHLEAQCSSSSTSVGKGILPGKPIPNPKEYTKAITLRSGKALPTRETPVSHNEDIVIQEEEDLVEGDAEVSAENESEAKKDTETPKASSKENKKKKETLFVPPPYKPPLPFPGRFKKQLVTKYKALFDKQVAEIEVKMPLLDAFMLIPPYQKFLKDAVLERVKESKGNTSSSSQKGTLPGKPIPTQKVYCGAISSTNACAAGNDEKERAIEEPSRLLYGPSVERSENEKTFQAEKRNDKKEEASKIVENEETTKVEPPPYKPELPFPRRVLTKAQPIVVSKFRTDLSEIGVHLPNMGNMQEAHLQMKLISDILANKEIVAALMEFCTPPAPPLLTPNSIPTLENQGKFTLPCTLGDLKLNDALVDSGASVNLISLAMVKRLGIKSLTSPTSSDMFGDATSKSPLGLVKDLPLKTGGCKVPIDLTVLDMVDDKEEKREAPFERKDYLYVPVLYETNFPFAGVISPNEVSFEDPLKPPFEEIRMKEFRGWFYDEYDPGDPSFNE